ncbi:MAG: hypothetical protein SFY96_11170 [Planctomycetota bacterium]|nr:hypothetical protein [Planctomycetota bacterium]
MDSETRLEPGTRADYLALERFHYLSQSPATMVRVLRAMDGGVLAGVLVVSMPTLNAWWRAKAWPGWEGVAGPDRAARAHAINADLRTISRVIIEPRWRATGLAAALVRAYLAEPLTSRTEALAAMGVACPFFERAGMRRVESAVVRDAELRRALRGADVRVWELMDEVRVRRMLRRAPRLERELRVWANRSRASRRWRNAPIEELAARAGWCASNRAEAYVHGG